MYLVRLKAAVVDALRATLADQSFIPVDQRNAWVGIEFPIEKAHYPGIWVNYDDQDSLQIAGIGQQEIVWDHPDPIDPALPDPAFPDQVAHEVTRWTFAGEVTMTVVALSSLERDNLYDQVVRVFAFSRMENAATDFRTIIENNDFVAMNVNWDQLRPHGDSAAPGVPWGSPEEVVYEKSVGFQVEGEFVSDPDSNELVRLSQIIATGTELGPDGNALDSQEYILG